ncbi:DUF192 domain-containing protein [Bartonella sp. 220]|uniref:DUF192 domain-containing protein n=1 Tax=Bartonella sp. 220B TaxID=2967260 RepID=UPI0022A9E4CF|nr:DUF192 domain-containing protein [Bartonella sp. 220B]MCZ2158985.1 DUF192 domain-containing protein [Bartonella sp. 220B]
MLKLFRRRIIVTLSLFFALGVGMTVAQKPIEIPVDPVPLKIQTKQGMVSYKVEVAFTRSQGMAGLMYRTHFPRDRAMLFKQQGNNPLEDKQEFSLWMANTPLPLDMIFLNAEGVIVSIVEKTIPFSTNVISSKIPAAFAIEVNAGEVSEKQIEKGQRVFHPAICGKCEDHIK